MVKIKEMSFLSTRGMGLMFRNCMYIAGDFNVEQIKCDPYALAESNRLLEIFNNSQKNQMNKRN